MKPLRVKRVKRMAKGMPDATLFLILERALDKGGASRDARVGLWALTLAGGQHGTFSATDEALEPFFLIAEQIYEPVDKENYERWVCALAHRLAHFEPELARLRQEIEY